MFKKLTYDIPPYPNMLANILVVLKSVEPKLTKTTKQAQFTSFPCLQSGLILVPYRVHFKVNTCCLFHLWLKRNLLRGKEIHSFQWLSSSPVHVLKNIFLLDLAMCLWLIRNHFHQIVYWVYVSVKSFFKMYHLLTFAPRTLLHLTESHSVVFFPFKPSAFLLSSLLLKLFLMEHSVSLIRPVKVVC